MDPFAVVLYREEKHKTQTKNNAGKTPVWNQTFDLDIKYIGDDIQVTVLDEDITESDTIGSCMFKPSTLCVPGGITEWFDLQWKGKKAGQIQIKGVWTPAGSKPAGEKKAMNAAYMAFGGGMMQQQPMM